GSAPHSRASGSRTVPAYCCDTRHRYNDPDSQGAAWSRGENNCNDWFNATRAVPGERRSFQYWMCHRSGAEPSGRGLHCNEWQDLQSKSHEEEPTEELL